MNILIIEDDILLAKNIKKIFEKQVITNRIKVLHSYEEFLREYVNLDYYDVLLTDIKLGKDFSKTGMDIIKIVRKGKAHLPIVVISCLSDISWLDIAFSEGANDYLIKPFRLKELQIRVIKWFKIYYSSLDLSNKNKKFYEELEYNLDSNNFFYNGLMITLTKKSKYILSIFLSSPDKLISEMELVEKVRGDEYLTSSKNVRICILRLKNSLKPFGIDDRVTNLRGEGYIFSKK